MAEFLTTEVDAKLAAVNVRPRNLYSDRFWNDKKLLVINFMKQKY
jgi:hypothetical protein